MTPTLEEINAILELGHKHRVRRLEMTSMGLLIEYEGRPPPIAALEAAGLTGPKSIAQALSDIEATDKCKCGHTEAAHNAEGECLQGCELEVCYPGNEPPPKPDATLEG